jgi:hypothetical protein
MYAEPNEILWSRDTDRNNTIVKGRNASDNDAKLVRKKRKKILCCDAFRILKCDTERMLQSLTQLTTQ